MAEYTVVINGLGHQTYKLGSKYIKKDKVPANILRQLTIGGPAISDEDIKLEAPLKHCIFCNEMTKTSRFINMQTIYLCDEHYHSMTTGQVVQQLREPFYEVQEPQASEINQS